MGKAVVILNVSPIDSVCIWLLYHFYDSGTTYMSNRAAVVKTHRLATCIDCTMKNMLDINARPLLPAPGRPCDRSTDRPTALTPHQRGPG